VQELAEQYDWVSESVFWTLFIRWAYSAVAEAQLQAPETILHQQNGKGGTNSIQRLLSSS
jgi:hypothetical protein